MLDHLDVDDELLERCGQPALLPAGGVVDEVAVAEHRAPQRHHRLVGALRVGGVGGRAGRRAVGQIVAPRELARGDVGLGVFRRAEGRRAGAHVDVGGEGAVHDRRAGPDELRQHDAEQRLGILLRQRAGQRHRAHRAHQRERRDRHRLAVLGHRHQPLRHRVVEAARRVDRDDGGDAGSSRIWSSVRPREIAIMAMPSSALPRPIAETWKLLSVSVRLAK